MILDFFDRHQNGLFLGNNAVALKNLGDLSCSFGHAYNQSVLALLALK